MKRITVALVVLVALYLLWNHVTPLAARVPTQADPNVALAKAEAQWQKQKPSAYEFSVEVQCFCPDLLRKPISFRVTGATVQALEELKPGSQRVYEYYNSIDKLFDAIRRAIKFGGYKIAVDYDADLGFPSHAALDPRKTVVDDELVFKVTGFRKIRPPASDMPNEAGR
jgi:hypothetical protein